MTAPTRYSVVYDGEVVGTRKSARTYTHAVVVAGGELGRVYVAGYSGRRELADKLARKIEGQGTFYGHAVDTLDVVVVPVTIKGTARNPARTKLPQATKLGPGHYKYRTVAGVYVLRFQDRKGYAGKVWVLIGPDGDLTVHESKAEAAEDIHIDVTWRDVYGTREAT